MGQVERIGLQFLEADFVPGMSNKKIIVKYRYLLVVDRYPGTRVPVHRKAHLRAYGVLHMELYACFWGCTAAHERVVMML